MCAHYPASVRTVCEVCACACVMVRSVGFESECGNNNNSKHHLHNNNSNSTPTPVNPVVQKPQIKTPCCYCSTSLSSYCVISLEQRNRSRRWETAVSVAPAEVATLVGSSVAKSSLQIWQPRAHPHAHKHAGERATSHSHTHTQPLRKRCFLCPSVAKKKELERESEREYWIILFHRFDETSIFLFIFCCY